MSFFGSPCEEDVEEVEGLETLSEGQDVADNFSFWLGTAEDMESYL